MMNTDVVFYFSNTQTVLRGGKTKADHALLMRGDPVQTIADQGGGGEKNLNKRSLGVLKMWIKNIIDIDLIKALYRVFFYTGLP